MEISVPSFNLTISTTSWQPSLQLEGDLNKKRSVGFTVDMSVNLCNSLHFNDAMLPKVTVCGWKRILAVVQSGSSFYRTCMAHGTRAHRQGAHEEQLKGETFEGLANKFGHGVTIGWDGCVVRHCTSISQSDGLSGEKVGFNRIKIH
jgi:hypothetical protein